MMGSRLLGCILSLLLMSCSPIMAKEETFEQWKHRISKKFAKEGLEQQFVYKQLKKIEFDEGIIELDRNQLTASKTLDFAEWIQKWLNSKPPRLETAKKMLSEHAQLLAEIEKKYGVDKEVIISLWGVETLYGNRTGEYSIIHALATLAYDKRRRRFFESELLAAMRILSEGHVNMETFKGSWAGATGQCQFMPSSFLAYAQDFDGDGKKDIWTNHADIFASIANYLKKAGWKKGHSIGLLAKVANGKKIASPKTLRTAEQFNALGVRHYGDGKILKGNWKRRVEELPQKNAPIILKGDNYKAIMRWNRSSLFAALNILIIDSL